MVNEPQDNGQLPKLLIKQRSTQESWKISRMLGCFYRPRVAAAGLQVTFKKEEVT